MNAMVTQPTTTIYIEVMTSSDPSMFGAGGYIYGSQRLLAELINNDESILENYTLVLNLNNAENQRSIAIQQAIEICMERKPADSITIPVVLGLPTSTLSETVNPILDVYCIFSVF